MGLTRPKLNKQYIYSPPSRNGFERILISYVGTYECFQKLIFTTQNCTEFRAQYLNMFKKSIFHGFYVCSCKSIITTNWLHLLRIVKPYVCDESKKTYHYRCKYVTVNQCSSVNDVIYRWRSTFSTSHGKYRHLLINVLIFRREEEIYWLRSSFSHLPKSMVNTFW